MTGSVTTAAIGTTTRSAIGSRLLVGMRFIAVFAILIAGAAFAQQPDAAPSGVLVVSPPATFHDKVLKAVLTAPNLKAPQPEAPKKTARVCAVPLLKVPVRDHIDDGILLKDVKTSFDKTFGIEPAIPECR